MTTAPVLADLLRRPELTIPDGVDHPDREWLHAVCPDRPVSTLSRHRRKTKAAIHRKGEKMEAAVRDAK
ncbi:hypothetical protein ACFOFO_19275 [Undibacterium arcticum]|uniref:Uncharacterized protein n=1 Tax=Undibacterium arcticum TaxID=1762892 RepID=A0ABV7F717_9BURK